MPIVDTHCHVSPVWYEPVETLLFQMEQNHVSHALLIQCGGQFDNDYQTQCVERYPDRLASVVIVDTTQPDAPDRLALLAKQGAVGVRLSADDRSPGKDPLAIWRKAAELGLVISCRGKMEQFTGEEFAGLLEAFPDLPIIIEHLGGVKQSTCPEPPYTPAQELFALARYPNAYMKIHGLGEFAVRNLPVTEYPFLEPIPPFLEMVYDAFGPSRMMWGSDYPPVSGREGYRSALQLTRARFADKPASAVEQIFGGTALALFPTLAAPVH